jgi:hypothetical protein
LETRFKTYQNARTRNRYDGFPPSNLIDCGNANRPGSVVWIASIVQRENHNGFLTGGKP